MPVKKIYAVDSATVMNGTVLNGPVRGSFLITRGSTETIDTVTYNALPGQYQKRPFYVFDNSALPAGNFIRATVVIPKATSQNLNASAKWEIMNQRPTSSSAAGYIWNYMSSNIGWYSAGTWFDRFPGGAFELYTTTIENARNMVAYGVILDDGEGQSIQDLYTARSDLSVRPYIEYVYSSAEDPPTISATEPKDTVIDSDSPNIFKWSYSQVVNAPQTHVDIQQLYQGEWLSIASKTPWTAQQYTVPAGTLKPGGTAWRVRAYCNAGNTVSEWASANVTIVALQSEPPVVGIITPKDIIIDGDSPNLFTWTYEQPGGSPQSHVDIQYQYGGVWQSIADKTPLAEQKYTVPAGTLQAGQTRWRMRAYCNSGNIVSEWDEALITVKAKPGDPVITGAIGIPRPTLSWTHDGQQAGYQIQVAPVGLSDVMVDSGTVYSGSGYWQCPEYLADDDYTISLRIVTADQTWSNWVHVAVTVRNVPGEPIRLTSEPTRDYGTRLTWETDGSYPQYLVLRNGEAVGYAAGGSYVDYFSVGSAAYAVRGLSGNYYTDSNIRNACVKVPHAAISSVDPISWLKLEVRRGGRPVHEVSMAPNAAYLRFEGRSRPHRQTDDSGYADVTHSFTFTFRDRESYLKLKELVNKTVIYKDCMGEKVIGNLESVEATLDRVYDFEITITETDFNEAAYV